MSQKRKRIILLALAGAYFVFSLPALELRCGMWADSMITDIKARAAVFDNS